MKTIGRNHRRLRERIFFHATSCSVYTLGNGFAEADCPEDRAREALDKHGAKLIETEPGRYTVRVHSNLWYELVSRPSAELAKIRDCAGCLNCEYDEDAGTEPAEAEYYVEGRIPGGERWVPYRAYLCDDHLTAWLDDGADFPVQRKLGDGS